jgi:hypothetical protein
MQPLELLDKEQAEQAVQQDRLDLLAVAVLVK